MVIGLSQQSMVGQIIWLLLFFLLIGLYPKYLLFKMIAEMEVVVETLAGYTKDSAGIVKKIAKKKGGSVKDPMPHINRVMEFFLIPPVSLDPYGILKKIEYVIDSAEDRFDYVTAEISPDADKVWRANINSLLKGTIGLNMLTKMLRHYVEFAKKTGNFQIAMLFHMNLKLIKKIAEAQIEGVRAISKGKPIGDGIGPLVAANLIANGKVEPVAKDVVYSKSTLNSRRVHVLKADGPGATLGKIGEAVKKIAKKNKVKKIITIDASLKLEGEESGKVSEGIGAAIGDPGPEKSKIEEVAIELGIPLEAIVIKMSIEEAISPLARNIAGSVKNVLPLIEDSVGMVGAKEEVLIVGVGNTCGVGNTRADVSGMKFPKAKEEKEELSRLDRLIKKLATPPPKQVPKKKAKSKVTQKLTIFLRFD
jgi:hypothetical protein